MQIKNIDTVEKVKVNMEGAKNAFKQLPVSKKDGTPLYSFRVFTLEPEGHTPFHSHPFEHVNYVIQGQGIFRNEMEEEKGLKQGDFALVLPNEKHQYKNKSTSEPFIMICAVPKEYE
jgi:quercetin dioxygenase-like cupin family protein